MNSVFPHLRVPTIRSDRSHVAIAAVVALALSTTAIAQTNGTWTSTSGGTWGDSANWSGGTVASGTGAVANFSTLDITGVQTVTLNAPVTSGTLLFGDTTNANGGWTLTSSTLTLATVSGVPTISVTGLGSAYNYGTAAATISSVITGTNGLNKSGSSALVLSAANTYTGTTTVNGGYLVLNNNSALGSSSGVSVGTGAALAIGSGITAGTGMSVNIANFGGVGSDGALTAISGGTATWAGSVAINGGRVGYQYSNLVISGSIGGTGGLVVSGYGGDPLTSGSLQFAVTLSNTNNNYTGGTSIIRGVVKLGADNALPATGTLNVHSANNSSNSATFDLNGFNQTIAGIVSSGILDATGTVNGYASGFVTNSAAAVKTFTVNQATSGTMAAIMTGNLAFTKAGAGNLLLRPTLVISTSNGVSGTNTFSGDTIVSAGTLTLGNSTALFGSTFDTASAGTLSLGTLSAATFGGLKNSGTFTLTNSGSAFTLSVGGNNVSSTFAGKLTGLGGLTKVGTGTFTLAGATSDYSGATTLASGALALGSANALPASGTITFSGGALQYTASNTTDYAARIASSGSAVTIDTNGQNVTFAGGVDATNTGGLRKLGSGTLTLSGSSGYSGATTLSGGVLALGNANSLPAAGNVTFSGGTLQYSASNTSDLASRIVSSTSAIAIDTNGQSVTWAGNLVNTNTSGLTKTGAGTLTLSGSNTFTGPISITGGTLAVSGIYAFPTGAAVTGVSLNGGVLQATGSVGLNNPGGVPSSVPITLGAAGGTLLSSMNASTQWYIYGPIQGGAGTGQLSLSGTSGEIILFSSASNFTGGTILSNPQVAIATDAALGTGTITFTGGGLRATSAGARSLSNAITISAGAAFYGSNNNLTLSGPITLSGSTQTVTVTGTSLNSFAGAVGDGGATLGLVKSGTGILALGGANTYTGTTTFAGGLLRLTHASALAGGGNLSFAGGTLQYSGSNAADYSARIVGSSGAIAIDTNGQSVSFASSVAASNSGGLTKSGSGTLTLAADNAYTGVTTVSGGTLQIGDGGVAGSIAGNVTLSNTSGLVFNRSNNQSYAGSITGTGSIVKLGAATLSLSGTNTITGSTIIAGGTLSITGSSALPGTFTLDGGTIVNATGLTSFGRAAGIPAFTVGPGGGAFRSDNRMDPGNVISGTSSTALLTYGPTTTGSTGIVLVISGNNTYAANTKIEAGMDVVVDNNNAFGTGTLELAGARIRTRNLGVRTLANPLILSGNTQFFTSAATDNDLIFTGSTTLSGGTRTLQVDFNTVAGGTGAGLMGAIGDGGNGYGITKTGLGVLTLGGANTYSGATTLNSGTLRLANQAALQNSTLTLSGTGTVSLDAAVSANAFTFGGLSASSTAATLALQNSSATAIALTVGGNGASTTYAGSLTGAGSLEKVGAGTFVLSGSNTFAGTTTITGGTLQVGSGAGGSLAGNIVNNAVLVFSRSDPSAYAGGISGSGSMTKSGAGTLTLSGSNGYAGPTTLAGGMLALAGVNSLPATGDVTFTGGSLQYSSSYAADLSGRIVGSTGATVIDTNGQSVTFATSLAASNVGGLTKLGAGTLTLAVTNAFTGPVAVGGGVLALGDAAALPATGTVSFTGGTLQYGPGASTDLSARIRGSSSAIRIDTNGQDIAFASAINNTNAAGFVKSGAGTLTFSGSNNYGGNTTVSAGTLAFTTDSVWTGLSGTIALDNATLAYTGTNAVNQMLSLPIQLGASGGTLRNPGAAFWFVGGQISGAGPLTVGSGSTLMVFQGANTNSGGVSLQAGSQVVVANNSSGPAGAPTSGVFGTGTLTLAGGSLRSTTGAARTIGNAVSLAADTTFFTAGSNDDKNLTFTGPATLTGGNRTLTVNTSGTGSPAIVFSGAIGDGGNGYGLTKAGVGTLVFNGTSTYTGQTAVSSGALVVNGSILSSVALSGSTSLSGRGSVGAISGAGLVGPGNSPGILAATSVDPSGGLAFAFEFTQANPDYTNAAASGNDLLSISGGSPFTSSLTSANVVSVYLTPAAVDLGTLTGGFFTSSLQSDFLNSIANATYQYFVQDAGGAFSYNGQAYKSLVQYDASKSVTISTVSANGGQVMQMVVVPEPAALALAAIGIAVAGWSAVRRRR